MNGRVTKVGVIGAGGWGTALAIAANRAGSQVVLWTRNEHVVESVTATRINRTYLPDIFIDPRIQITDSLQEACACDMIIIAIPSQHMRATCIMLADVLDASVPVIIATKGIERGSLCLMTEVAASILPKNPLAVLTGPNFAAEVARGQPAAVTLACQSDPVAGRIMFAIGGKFFRPYHTDDMVGPQIGGAVKNVIAIACGIVLGRGLGQNARAALITRGLAEMTRLCVAKGGRPETLMGLSGMGDLVLTCTSETSRNMSLGAALCTPDKSVRQVIDTWHKKLAEGVTTADSVASLAQKLNLSMPICNAVHGVLHQNQSIDDVIQGLMERQFTPEIHFASL